MTGSGGHPVCTGLSVLAAEPLDYRVTRFRGWRQRWGCQSSPAAQPQPFPQIV